VDEILYIHPKEYTFIQNVMILSQSLVAFCNFIHQEKKNISPNISYKKLYCFLPKIVIKNPCFFLVPAKLAKVQNDLSLIDMHLLRGQSKG